jgi:phage FluMu gp28-like protein
MLTTRQKKRLAETLRMARRDKVFFAKALFRIELGGKQVEAVNLGGRVNVKVAGRRFGKSTTTLVDVVHECATKPKQQWYITGPSIDQAKIYFHEFEQRANENPLLSVLVKDFKWSPFPEITLINGSKIMGRSTARDGVYLRGKGANGVAITEAAFIKDKVYQEVIRAMVLDRKGVIRLESTPNGHNYFFKLFQDALNDSTGYYRAIHATCFDNPRLDPDELERIRFELPELAWRIEYLAEFVEDDTFIFPWSVLAEVFDDYEPQERPGNGHRYVIGVDLAKYQDYTVIIVLDVTRVPYRLAEWHRYQGKLYTDVAAHVNELQEKYKARVYLDATGVGDPVAEQIRNCEPFVFSERTRQELISNLTVLIQQKRLCLPASWTVLRDELRYFRNVRRGMKVRPEAAEGYHDDTVMALALACWSVKAGKEPLPGNVRSLFKGVSMV